MKGFLFAESIRTELVVGGSFLMDRQHKFGPYKSWAKALFFTTFFWYTAFFAYTFVTQAVNPKPPVNVIIRL